MIILSHVRRRPRCWRIRQRAALGTANVFHMQKDFLDSSTLQFYKDSKVDSFFLHSYDQCLPTCPPTFWVWAFGIHKQHVLINRDISVEQSISASPGSGALALVTAFSLSPLCALGFRALCFAHPLRSKLPTQRIILLIEFLFVYSHRAHFTMFQRSRGSSPALVRYLSLWILEHSTQAAQKA